MRFKVDENLPAEVAEGLRTMGHAAHTVEEEGLSGAPDPEIIAAAEAEKRILLTLDKGIANQLRYPSTTHRGVVLFQPKSVARGAALAFVMQHLEALTCLRSRIESPLWQRTESGFGRPPGKLRPPTD